MKRVSALQRIDVANIEFDIEFERNTSS